MNLIKSIDNLWQKRSTSVLGYVLVGLAGLATPQGHQLMSIVHIPPATQAGLDTVQNFLVITGLGLSARGVGPLGGGVTLPPAAPPAPESKNVQTPNS